jgi:hypothetical protein
VRFLLLGFIIALLPCNVLADQPTKVVLYLPFGFAGLRSGYTVVTKANGHCSDSHLTGRVDAWRCMANNTVYDPCFSNNNLSSLACPTSAFSKAVVLIALDRPLPLHQWADVPVFPWALRLSSGVRCQWVDGKTGVIAGMRLSYACSSRGWVLGWVSDETELHVPYSPNPDGSNYHQVPVSEVVY